MLVTPDDELLAAFRGGDREAFAVLVARHQDAVRAACLRQAPASEVEDCVQAVFLVLARRPGAAIQAPALVAWLLRVTWYVCRRAQRGSRRRRLAEQQSAHPNATDTHLRPEALDHLDECLAKLPERQRVAVSMHFLAERSADEVATALGVSRDNTYQLVSRGLATLRSLLVRRGIALSTPALLALLANEGHAATAAGTNSSIAASISTTPSAHALNLASGVTTAMTLAAPPTITLMAASLLLAAGITSAVVTAEPTALPAPAPVQPVPTPSILDAKMNQEITVDFHDQTLPQVIDFVQKVTGSNFIIEPQLRTATTPRVSLMVNSMELRHVLAHICRLTATTFVQRDAAFFIQADSAATKAKPGARFDLTSADANLSASLEQRITFDFDGTPLTDVISYLRQVSHVNMIVMPAVSFAKPPVTLNGRDMYLKDALKWICELTKTSIWYVDQALVFDAIEAQ